MVEKEKDLGIEFKSPELITWENHLEACTSFIDRMTKELELNIAIAEMCKAKIEKIKEKEKDQSYIG